MLTIKITDQQRTQAKLAAAPLAKKYANNPKSIRKGQGIYIAKLAEQVVADTLGFEYIDTPHADTKVILKSGQKRLIEVKVKERTVPPRGSYNGTVADYNPNQRCDYYLFCSTLRDEVVYLIGLIPKDRFLKAAAFYRKGVLDPESPPNYQFTFKADCYNMAYREMSPVGKEELPD